MDNNEVIEWSFKLYKSDLDHLDEITSMNPFVSSKTEAVRSAIATELFFRNKVANGAKIIIEEADGKLHQVLITNRSE